MPVKAHKKDEDPLESPSLHSSHVVMVGVPAEIAVAISLASFLIGAALTGLLCRIHQKRTMNNKTVRTIHILFLYSQLFFPYFSRLF